MNKLISKAKNETLNLRVVGSSPTLGAAIFFDLFQRTHVFVALPWASFIKVKFGVKVFF